jgi:hypothetical protein
MLGATLRPGEANRKCKNVRELRKLSSGKTGKSCQVFSEGKEIGSVAVSRFIVIVRLLMMASR